MEAFLKWIRVSWAEAYLPGRWGRVRYAGNSFRRGGRRRRSKGRLEWQLTRHFSKEIVPPSDRSDEVFSVFTPMKAIANMRQVLTMIPLYILVQDVRADVQIDWAVVDNPGNASDATGYGSVSYGYQIGKNETPNRQYVAFLNEVDRNGINPFGIYNPNMGTDPRGGISFSAGAMPGMKYAARGEMSDKPVNFISWFDAARFANWLHNGQGGGSTETGAYSLGGATSGIGFVKEIDALVWLPTEDEWYKAAHYDPAKDVSGGYWRYATKSNAVPTIALANSGGVVSNPGTNVANYGNGFDWNGLDGNVATVGSAGAASYYGTFDQSGNVWEWTMSVQGPLNNKRGLRGGAFHTPESNLRSTTVFDAEPWEENDFTGFRVAGVLPDSDGDGLPDVYETGTGVYVSPTDTGTDPRVADTDSDGLNDGAEVLIHGSNPLLADTDGDGFTDGFEVSTGFDPSSNLSVPESLSFIHTAVEFRFSAALGVSYRIEASTDLSEWHTIETDILGEGGLITRFYSTQSSPNRHFRTRRN